MTQAQSLYLLILGQQQAKQEAISPLPPTGRSTNLATHRLTNEQPENLFIIDTSRSQRSPPQPRQVARQDYHVNEGEEVRAPASTPQQRFSSPNSCVTSR